MFAGLCLSSAEEAFVCKTDAVADIVILVDGSWSIGRMNFRLVRAFLENLVKAFNVEFDKTRIGEQLLTSEQRGGLMRAAVCMKVNEVILYTVEGFHPTAIHSLWSVEMIPHWGRGGQQETGDTKRGELKKEIKR